MSSPLDILRLGYEPTVPRVLREIESLVAVPGEVMGVHGPHAADLELLFPKTNGQRLLKFARGDRVEHEVLNVGVVLSGGQAAGGHNVIIGLFDALQKLNGKSCLYGFLNGPSGIIEHDYRELDGDFLATYRNQGGFDMIGSGRTKIETLEQFAAAEKVARSLKLDGLVVIGGDDSNTNAALLAEYFEANGCKTCVVGVPKTIDGDLKNEHIRTSFGFDTAAKTFSNTIGSLLRDALSAKKYTFFIKLMGRSASHLTLEAALQTHPNMALIGEEIAAEGKTFDQVVGEIADMVSARAEQGKNYGAVLIPEGVVEFIPEFKVLISELNAQEKPNPDNLTEASRRCYNAMPKRIQEQLLLDRDPHGNVKVSQIETERLFIEAVSTELKRRPDFKGEFSAQPLFYGYEARSCPPSNFDAEYCNALGQVAALLIDRGATGYMCCIQDLHRPAEEWQIAGVPIVTMMTMEQRHGQAKPVIEKALVDLEGGPFQQFKAAREGWKLNDDYRYPGPVQLFGPPKVTDGITFTLNLSE